MTNAVLPTNEVATTKTAATLLDQMFDNFNNCNVTMIMKMMMMQFFEEKNNS